MVKKKDSERTNKIIIGFIVASIFIFTGVAIYLQYKTSIELSATLITCFFGFCTGELWMLASIKKAKIYTDVDNDGIPDDEDPYIDEKYYSYTKGVDDALNKVREILSEQGEDM